MEPTTYSSLHHAVAFLERESCKQWAEEHRLDSDLELALAQYGQSIEVLYERVPGGHVSVHISVVGIDERHTTKYFYSLARAGNRAYKRLEPTPK